MPIKNATRRNMYFKNYMLTRYYERKADAIKHLGGKCVVCGCTENLEFDHVDPDSKSWAIGKKLASVAADRLKIELNKCQLLCSTHHAIKHSKN